VNKTARVRFTLFVVSSQKVEEDWKDHIMLRNVLLSGAALICLGMGGSASKEKYWTCLPNGIDRTDVVSTREVQSRGRREIRKTTVDQKLKEVKASCRRGKLLDASGTEIRFYKLAGCWGHPSDDDREVLDRQNQELAKLRKNYRVIELTCNPSGEQIP
jgi:hypothetical protein